MDGMDEAIWLKFKIRRVSISLPLDPSDDELARDWILSEADTQEVSKCRGKLNRIRFGVQLCVLRKHGKFLDHDSSVPARIANYIAGQLRVTGVLFLPSSDRSATDTHYEKRIAAYLGYRTFQAEHEAVLKKELSNRAHEGMTPEELKNISFSYLMSRKVIPPAVSKIEFLVREAFSSAYDAIFGRIASGLSEGVKVAMDSVLQVPSGKKVSPLLQLKEYPPGARATDIVDYLERLRVTSSILSMGVDLGAIPEKLIEHFHKQVKSYNSYELRRFDTPKRHSLIACFLTEALKITLDNLVRMNDQFLIDMFRESQKQWNAKLSAYQKDTRRGMHAGYQAVQVILDDSIPDSNVRREVYSQLGRDVLFNWIDCSEKLKEAQAYGLAVELKRKYRNFQKYFVDFLKLPFAAAPGNEDVLSAVGLALSRYEKEAPPSQEEAITTFMPATYRNLLEYRFQWWLWEVGLAFSLKERLRSGDIYLAQSKKFVSFWKLVYQEEEWKEERSAAYSELSLSIEPETALSKLEQDYYRAAALAAEHIAQNPFAEIDRNGRLKTHKDDAFHTPPEGEKLKLAIESNLPQIRIEDLLYQVDYWTKFTNSLRPQITDYQEKPANLIDTILAAITAHGTNLGVIRMANSTHSISAETLQNVSKVYLHEEQLKAANAAIVNYHHKMRRSSVWGKGKMSSSDGQRFAISKRSLIAGYYPRYFGYYDKAVTLYTHVSDQFTVFSSQVISCKVREALHVLDGLLENNTILRMTEHTTDTHGYTEPLFGLCYLLGFSFMPRIRDLKDQQLYSPNRDIRYGALDVLFRGGFIDTQIIKEQWDQLVRIAASLKNRTAPAHVVLQRLTCASPSDRVAKALLSLGRIVKTIHILRYIEDEQLRRSIQMQLNRGEARHRLANHICFYRKGEFRTSDLDELMSKASCLSVISNAVVLWNTIQISRIVDDFRAKGEEISDENLSHVWPLAHAHVIANGTYFFGKEVRARYGIR